MYRMRPSYERGLSKSSGVHSRHSFSFGSYEDEVFSSYADLLALNEDHLAPSARCEFNTTAAVDIITLPLNGALTWEDAGGHLGVLVPGDIQCLSANDNQLMKPYNAQEKRDSHSFSLWLRRTSPASHDGLQRLNFSAEDRRNRFCLIASQDGRMGSAQVSSNSNCYLTDLTRGATVTRFFPDHRRVWVQALSGTASASGITLSAGDGVSFINPPDLSLTCIEPGQLLTIDLA